MKSYETLQAMARQNTAFRSQINGMGVVQGELMTQDSTDIPQVARCVTSGLPDLVA
jgi:hypothetical protein